MCLLLIKKYLLSILPLLFLSVEILSKNSPGKYVKQFYYNKNGN